MKPSQRLAFRQYPRYQFSPVRAGNAMISTANKKFGISSLILDGSGDSVQVYDTATALRSGDFTIECWAYYTSVSSRTNGICDFRTSAVNQLAHSLFVNTSAQIILNVNGVTRITAGGVPANSWWHFAYSRSGTNNRIFINGTQAGSTWVDGSNYTLSQFIIGSLTGGNNNPALGFYDEWRISRTARYTANFTAPTSAFTNDEDTLLLLHFNDYNGSTSIVDDIGDLIPVGTRPAISVFVTGNTQISTSEFKFGSSSAYFDGTNDCLRVDSADSTYLGIIDFTIEMWFYSTNLDARHLYDGRSITGSQVAPLIRYDSTGTLTYFVNGANRITSSSSAIAANTWYHVAVSRSGTNTRMFLDGVQVGSTYTDSNVYLKNVIGIGGYTTGANSHQGYIDEVRISNTARYTSNFTPSTTAFSHDDNTILLLHMEGSNGSTTFTDSTS